MCAVLAVVTFAPQASLLLPDLVHGVLGGTGAATPHGEPRRRMRTGARVLRVRSAVRSFRAA